MVDPILIVPVARREVFDPSGGIDPTYHGGQLLTGVRVQPVYWGAAWSEPAQALLISELQGFFQFIVTSPLMDMLHEYSVAGQTIGRGTALPHIVVASPEPGGASGAVDDSAVQSQIDSWANDRTIVSGADLLSFVFLPPGVTSTMGGSASCSGYCGYHALTPGGNAYALIPYVSCAGCSQGAQLETFTVVASHELAEAVTDTKNGWWDSAKSGEEIGDFCVGDTAILGGYLVQRIWSNSQNACVVAPGLASSGGTGA